MLCRLKDKMSAEAPGRPERDVSELFVRHVFTGSLTNRSEMTFQKSVFVEMHGHAFCFLPQLFFFFTINLAHGEGEWDKTSDKVRLSLHTVIKLRPF